MIRKIIVLLIILFSCLLALSAQCGVSAKLIKSDVVSDNIVEPQFLGGEPALYKFLENNIKYPPLLIKIQMEGDVDVSFKVDKEGLVKDIIINRGFDPLADEEVIKALKRLPKWKPATENGEAVIETQRLLVTFTWREGLADCSKEMEISTDIKEVEDSMLIEDSSISITQIDTLLNREPQFPGGKEALDAYLKKNMKYPKRALQMRVEGRVIFNILVSEDGEITNLSLFKGVYRDCDEEAFYLIKNMPKWIPGLKDGQPIAMQVNVVIPFVLPKH